MSSGKFTCRGPMVEHCSEFNYDGTDTCAKCQTFYAIDANGLCDYQMWFALVTVIILGVLAGLFGFFWVVDLATHMLELPLFLSDINSVFVLVLCGWSLRKINMYCRSVWMRTHIML